jgi:hypothetical protein
MLGAFWMRLGCGKDLTGLVGRWEFQLRAEEFVPCGAPIIVRPSPPTCTLSV